MPGIDAGDSALLRPRQLYESQGRGGDYAKIVDRLKGERAAFLSKFPVLSDEIVAAVGR